MEKRPRPFTAEKRFAEISGSTASITNDDLLDAFNDLSAYVKEVLSRASRLESSPSSSPAPEEEPEEEPGEENKDKIETDSGDGIETPDDTNADLSRLIGEVAALKSANPDEDKLPLARHELETVVEITDKAANEIMNQTDEIQIVIDKIRDDIASGDTAKVEGHLSSLEGIATNLLMACEFQDLTGQRINKVSNTIHRLEEQIGDLFLTLGIAEGTGAGGLDVTDSGDERPDKDLLHGPQDEDASGSISQADIDAMFD